MTLLAYLAGDDHAHNVRLGGFGLITHADGSVGFGGITFDDPDGTLDVRGWMEVIVEEDECVDAPILFRGWIGDRTESRSNGETVYRSGPSRFIDTNLVDPNDALVIRLMVNGDAKRPAETDIRRINYILSTFAGGLTGLVTDLGLVDRSTPRPFQEADYRGMYARDVLADLAEPLGRIFFVYINQPDGELGLFYDFPTSTVATSPLSISNDIVDSSDQCFYPLIDANNHLDPSEVVSLVRFQHRNGVVLEGDTDTYDEFFSDTATGGIDLLNRGVNVSNDRVGEEDTARRMARGVLAKGAVERSTVTVSIILPASQVGLIDVGQRVAVKFTHLTGYGSFTYVRVVARQIQQYITSDQYVVTYELSNDALRGNGGGGSTGPGDFPHPPPSSLSIIQQSVGLSTRTFPHTAGAGDELAVLGSMRAGAVTLTGYTDSGEGNVSEGAADYVNAGYKTALGTETGFTFPNLDALIALYELSAGAVLVDHASGHGTSATASCSGSVTIPAGGIALMMVGTGSGGGMDAGYVTPGFWEESSTPFTEDYNGRVFDGHPYSWAGHYLNDTGADVVLTPSIDWWYGEFNPPWPWQIVCEVFGPGTTSSPPTPGQDVPWEVVTMSTVNGVSVGTTAHPYADRSLLVKVDGLLISPASYVETDGQCGDFALTWKIDADEVVTVKYIGR